MAKKKISGLPASGALTGTEIVPIVQSGTTKRTTTQAIADLGGGGGISGSGTANYLSKWSDGTTLTDSLIQDDGNVVSVYGINENLLFLDKTQPYSVLLSTDGSGIWNSTKLVTIGDVYENYNGTNIVVDLDAQIIKTRNGADKGLYINYPDDIYALGWTETGDFINDNVIGFSSRGYVFQMGEAGGISNKTYFEIDDSNQIIKTSNAFTDKGLYIDYPNGIYALGFTETGDFVGENVLGVKLTSDNITIGDTWSYTSYIDISFSTSRTYLETNRLHYRNLTTTEINGLTATAQEGDVVYNVTLHALCFYNGSSWQKVNHSNM